MFSRSVSLIASTFPLVLSVLARKWALDYTVHDTHPARSTLRKIKKTCILFLDRIVCDSSSRLTYNSVVSFAVYFSALGGGCCWWGFLATRQYSWGSCADFYAVWYVNSLSFWSSLSPLFLFLPSSCPSCPPICFGGEKLGTGRRVLP